MLKALTLELVAVGELTLEDGPKQMEEKEEQEEEEAVAAAAAMVDQPVMPRRFLVWCHRACAWCTWVASSRPPSKCTRAGAR